METQVKPSLGFAQRRLPWIVTAVALVVYLVTLNRWVRLESLTTVANVGGWNWTPVVSAPLYFLLTLPVSALPTAIQPLVLNGLNALLGALALGLLARSAALLPYDRTRETRERERSEFSLLSLPLAWWPPMWAVLLCGFQLTFWEQATAATAEMLDLVLFAYVIRCLLEFRIDRRDRWLYQALFVYGLGMTNNYAMIAFLPCFVVAVVWVKGWEILDWRLVGRLVLAGVLGLLGYLILPLAGLVSGDGTLTFFQYLRTVLGVQRGSLGGMPPYVVVLLSFTSLIPVLLIGIRWSSTMGDTSAAGSTLNTLVLRLVQLVLLAACVSVFFDTKWSPRVLGAPFALLPFYYLAALCAAYFVGYFMVLSRPARMRGAARPPRGMDQAGGVVGVLAIVVGIGLAVGLAYRNVPVIRSLDGSWLGQMADQWLQALPAQDAYVLGDMQEPLYLVNARVSQKSGKNSHVFVHSRSLEYSVYQTNLTQRYGANWPRLPDSALRSDPIDGALLLTQVAELTLKKPTFYLNPSFGFYFEVLQLRPRGLAYQVSPLKPDPLVPPNLNEEDLAWNRKFWEGAEPMLQRMPTLGAKTHRELAFILQYYSRALNVWGVALQRHGQAAEATRWFESALRLNPQNLSAKVNLEFNQALTQGKTEGWTITGQIEAPSQYRTWDEVLVSGGPLDVPMWTFKIGEVFAQGGLYRQALGEFARVQQLVPTNPNVQLWRMNMEIMTRFGLGDTAGAEKQALALHERYPKDENALEALTQVYLLTGRIKEALATVDKQLQLDPDSQRALLNKAAFHIQMSNYAQAIPPLDRLLAKQPDDRAALLNRAISFLQTGQLERAKSDYQNLQRLMPESGPVYYGLGEIAYRQKDQAAAVNAYELYLKHAAPGTEEYRVIAKRLNELKGGGKR